MKTAVSIPDQLFADADAAARRLQITRSQLYARALEAFLAGQEIDPVTEKLDELAGDYEAAGASYSGRRLIDEGQWEW
ncbi:MAG: hypothetical protein WD178_06965 [Actinomycetota bacterium]